MKRIIAVVVLLCSFAVAQQSGIVNEAKAKKEAEYHAHLVDKAKCLLKEKEDLQVRIAAIDKKLDKLDAGQDVKDDALVGGVMMYNAVTYNGSAFYSPVVTACCGN